MDNIIATSTLKEEDDSVEVAYVSGVEDYIIPIVYPDYKVSFAGQKLPYLGHAGVLIIQGTSGKTKYYEYGSI
jgi:hypothetical protein